MEMNMRNPFRKKSWIRFYSLERYVQDLYPLIPTSQLKRSWMKDEVKKNVCPFSGTQSSSNCPGIKQWSRLGWVLRAPADFVIVTNGDGTTFQWEVPHLFNGNNSYISDHVPEQTIPILDSPRDTLKTTVKVETPWRIRASDDIVLIQTHVHWNNEPRFTAATGILDPRYALQANAQLFWHVLNGETCIKAGTPLVQYIPIPRKYIERNWYDVYVDNADEEDMYLEQSFMYANSSHILRYDSVQDRVRRAMKILSNYTAFKGRNKHDS
jgi:hypothetical protein